MAGSVQSTMDNVMRKWTTSVAACGMAAWILGAGATVAAAQGEEHGLSQKAVEIARPFGFPITNSMLVMWIVAVGLIVFAQLATRNMKQVPDGAQNFLEWLIEGLYGFLEGIIGPTSDPADVLVLRERLHLHPRRELGRPDSRRRLDGLGTSDGRRVSVSRSRSSAAPTPT